MLKNGLKDIIGGIVILVGGVMIVIGLFNIYQISGYQWGVFTSLIVMGLLIIVFSLFYILKNNLSRIKGND